VPNLNFQDATPVNFNWICKCNQFRVYWVGMGIKHEKKPKKKPKKSPPMLRLIFKVERIRDET
jgi:hypothetical protein